jgi:hypothetical protein
MLLGCGEVPTEDGARLPEGPDAVIGRLENARGEPFQLKSLRVAGVMLRTDQAGVFALDGVPESYELVVPEFPNAQIHVFTGLTSRRPIIRLPVLSWGNASAEVSVRLDPIDIDSEIMVFGQTASLPSEALVTVPSIYGPPSAPVDVRSTFHWGVDAPVDVTFAAMEFQYDDRYRVRSIYASDAQPTGVWYLPTGFSRLALETFSVEPGTGIAWTPQFVPIETRAVTVTTRDAVVDSPDDQFVYAQLPSTGQLTLVNQNLFSVGEDRMAVIPDIPGAEFFLLAQSAVPPAYQGGTCATLVPVPNDRGTVEVVHGVIPELVAPAAGASAGANTEFVTSVDGLHTVWISVEGREPVAIHTEKSGVALPDLGDFDWDWVPGVDYYWHATVHSPAIALESMAVPAVPHSPYSRETRLTSDSGETCLSEPRTFRFSPE